MGIGDPSLQETETLSDSSKEKVEREPRCSDSDVHSTSVC